MSKDRGKQRLIPTIRFKGFTDDWEQRKLGDIVVFLNGRAYKQAELLDSGKYPVLRVGNFNTNDKWYYSDLELPAKNYADKGDLLYTWATAFGPHIWKGPKVIYHYHIWKVETTSDISKNFAVHLLDADQAQMTNSLNGSTMVHITKGTMENKIVTIPGISEQRNMARLLDQLDCTIALHQRKYENLQAVKKELLKRMFASDKKPVPDFRFNGYTNDWEQRKLDEISSISSGGTPRRDVAEYWNGNIPWVTTAEVNYQLIVDTAEKITSNGMASSAAKMIPKGSIVMAMYGQGKTRGQVGILGMDAATNQANANITVHNSSLTKIVYYQLESNYSRIRRLANEGGQANLSLGIVSSLTISITHDDEAVKIAKVLDEISQTVALHQRKLEDLKQLKKVLLQKLFV